MKKSQLKEIVQNIIQQRLNEQKGIAKHGYILAGKDSPDPIVQMSGYGNMPLSRWKKKIIDDVRHLLKQVELEQYQSAASLLDPDGVLFSEVAMLGELNPRRMEEALDTDSAAAANPTVQPSSNPSEKDQKVLADFQKKLNDLTDKVKDADAQISRLNEPVQRQIARLNLRKAQFQKLQGPLIDKIGQLQKKIADETAAGAQTTQNITEIVKYGRNLYYKGWKIEDSKQAFMTQPETGKCIGTKNGVRMSARNYEQLKDMIDKRTTL